MINPCYQTTLTCSHHPVDPLYLRQSIVYQQFEAPPLLDGSLACDCGFDPLGIAKSQKELFALREAGG